MLFSISFVFSQNRYWVTSAPSNWSSNSWSSSATGLPDGLGAPTGAQTAVFTTNFTGDCNVDIAVNINNIRVLSGYVGVIDINGNTFNLNGNSTSRFQDGTINDSPGTSALNINTTGTVEFLGSTINSRITGTANAIQFNGGVFNGLIDVETTSGGSSGGTGGCTFNADVKLTNSGTGYMMMGNGSPDIFNGNLELVNTSTSRFRMAYNSVGNQLNGNLTVSNTGGGIWFGENGGTTTLATSQVIAVGVGGFTSGEFRLQNFVQSGTTIQSLSLSGTAILRFRTGTVFNGNVDFDAPRIYLDGATFNGVVDIEKTGATNDAGNGGNTFSNACTFRNSGTGYFMIGNTNPDVFNSDLTLYNTSSSGVYVGNNSIGNTIAGDFTLHNSPTGSASSYIANGTSSSVAITGNVSIYNNGNSTAQNVYLGNNGDVTVGGNITIENVMTGTSNSAQVLLGNGTNSTVDITGNVLVQNGGTGATSVIYLGNNGDITFNGTLTIENHATANSSQVYCNHDNNGTNIYNDNIIVSSNNAINDGVYFGNSEGVGTLAAGATITVGGSGFLGRYLYLRNFTQVGATNQNLTLTGDARLELFNSDWGGNLNFSSPTFYTRGTRYRNSVIFTKTGATGDYSNGGNQFDVDLEMNNSGSGTFSLGNTNPDTFGNDVTINNTGSGRAYIAYNSPGNTIARDLTITNSATGAYSNVQVNVGTNSTLTVGGNCMVNNTSSSTTSEIYISNGGTLMSVAGDLTLNNFATGTTARIYVADDNAFNLGGDLNILNTGTMTNGYVYISDNSTANVTITGTTDVQNTGAGDNRYVYLGSQGDVTFNGDLAIENASSAVNSRVYCNNSATSNNSYNGNITLESTNSNVDGIYFGYSTGTGVLAATRTVTIGSGGFVAGELRFRNFTQTGNTAHTIALTGTSTFYNYDSDWGGDVAFTAPRMYTRGTRYRRTANLTKNGANNDYSDGGNAFDADYTMNNSGTGYFLIGANVPDIYQGNVTLNNSGTSHIYIGHTSTGNTIAGNLTATNAASGTNSGSIYVCSGSNSEISIAGNVTLTNNGSANNNRIYLGNGGKISAVGGNLIAMNNTTGNRGEIYLASSDTLNLAGDLTMSNVGTSNDLYIYLANSSTSYAAIGGNTQVTNAGTGNLSRIYLSNQGDAVFNGSLTISNSSSANNSRVYANHSASSNNLYNENIIVESYHANSDGIAFGEGNGTGTLAATKTVTIGANGYTAGELRFRNFTQIGATAQTINMAPAGTGYFYNYDSDWGGDVNFSGPRMITRGTIYRGTAYLEKTNASHDGSAGGNTFTGNTELRNTGTGYFLMGNGAADVFQADLTMNNLSAHHMYLAYNSSGNTVAGNLVANNSSTGSGTGNMYFSNNSASTLNISGNVTLNNLSAANNSYVYLGDQGDVSIQGNLDITNNSTSNNVGEFRVASSSSSTVDIVGNVSVINNGISNYNRIYFYNSGNGTVDGTVNINNTNTASRGYVYIANGSSSSATFNSTVDMINGGANSNKQIYVANQGDIVFADDISLTNTATASSSACYFNHGSNSSNSYNGNIVIESYGANCDGIRFGEGGGAGTLANTKTVSLGTNGFTDGHLYFRNFTQLGNTPQAITTTNNSRFENRTSTWNGNVTFISPRVHTRQTTYNGITFLEKTGGSNDASYGGNIYNDDVTFRNSGTGYFMPTNNNASDHNGDVTYVKTSTGLVYPTYSSTSTYAGDINISANSTINFGANTGRVEMDGTTPQSINDVSSSPEPNFRRLRTNNTVNEITLNIPINVQTELDLVAGNIISNATNFITMRDNATVANVSDNAFVDGPLQKRGNDLFEFPVGKNGTYRPIQISAPSSSSAQFMAEFFPTDPHLSGWSHSLKDVTLDHISNCEYWILDRTNTTNAVNVRLYYDSYGTSSCSGVDNQPELAVARWDGAMWKDHGNGGWGGTTADGWVETSGVVTSFSPFTLASTTTNNPLPIELTYFEAVENGTKVDLSWETASEIDNDYFTIERSQDGIYFEAIEKVLGAGNSTQSITYSTVDEDPYSGVSYYRLKQTDFNGAYTYSDIQVVHFSKSNEIVIYPNPVKDVLTINGLQFDDVISIYGIDGKIVYTGNATTVNTESYSHGVYQLVILHNNGTKEVIKFVK
jgi:hypothetical protein